MIVSTTLLGPNRADVVREAIRSVLLFVDRVLVIDTGSDEETAGAARLAAGARFQFIRWPWQDDFAAARNQALSAAAEIGATWALTLDTDERVSILNATTMRAELAQAEADGVDTLQAPHAGAGYVKPRFIRATTTGRWRGPNHEGLYQVRSRVTRACSFWEAPRTEEHLDEKWRRNLRTLIPFSAKHPDEQRWHYYIAEAHRQLGENDAAIARYRTCVSLRGWNEEGAWAAYRGAELLYRMGRHMETIAMAATGMARHAGFAELPLIASLAAGAMGSHHQALYWARLARVHGIDACGPLRAIDDRIGFRNGSALESASGAETDALRSLGLA